MGRHERDLGREEVDSPVIVGLETWFLETEWNNSWRRLMGSEEDPPGQVGQMGKGADEEKSDDKG